MTFDPTNAEHQLAPIGPRPDRIPARDFGKFPLDEAKWQRLGDYRIVSALIPEPIAYLPRLDSHGQPVGPYSWIGWRGVLSADGRAWDYETGREMTTRWREPPGFTRSAAKPGSRLIEKAYKKR